MGSKKHKKHHKYEKRERSHDVSERPEKRLKLVLKVGGSSASEHGDSPHIHRPTAIEHSVQEEVRSVERERYPEKHKKSKKKKKKKSSEKDRHERKHKHHHHHSHEKKEKQKRDIEDSGQEEVDVLVDGNDPMLKRTLFGDETPERCFREPRACTLKNRQGKSALQHLLDYLLKALEKKDPQQVFAWPVTDHIAPGYSSIITQPMDFSTMRQKIENNEYQCISDFKTDLKLMCDNCMVYNRPDTIYFKAAKKMLHIGLKMMTKDKLLPLRCVLTYMNELSSDELGFDLDDETLPVESGTMEIDEDTPVKEVKKKIKPPKPTSRFEAYQDALSPEEILAEAQKAAAKAAAKLTLKRPNTKFGFLRQLKGGTTTLAVLNSDDRPPETHPVTLGMLTGKLTQGTGSIAGFTEDKRNIAKPMNYLNYGSFSSYAPVFDSSFSNLTKEESDLLYSAYGDETGYQYAESILNFCKNSDYMTAMVDNLLDTLTNGEHSKAMKKIEEKRKSKEPSISAQVESLDNDKKNCRPKGKDARNPDSVSIDYDSLRSLADLGIDVSFLDDLDKEDKLEMKSHVVIQKKLDETSALLSNLQQAQHDRLSLKPPSHLAHIMEPSTNEIQLAEKVTESLKDLAKQTTPMGIASLAGLRKAMGITLEPFYNDEDGQIERRVDSSHVGENTSRMDSAQSEAGTTSEQEEHPGDLESELQEFLDTGPNLKVSDSPSHVEETLGESLIS